MFESKSLDAFCAELASKAPVPGGGGASALAGAIGAALASMVCNLTAGKKKYAAVEGDVLRIAGSAERLRIELLALIDGDAECFEPLSRAYSIPKDDPNREAVMESALRTACGVPMEIMRCAARAIELHAELADKGSALAISDVGVGALMCSAAMKGASLNVFINTKSMTDRMYAQSLENEAEELLATYTTMADEAYGKVLRKLKGES